MAPGSGARVEVTAAAPAATVADHTTAVVEAIQTLTTPHARLGLSVGWSADAEPREARPMASTLFLEKVIVS